MKKRIVLLFIIFSSINLFAETSLLKYSDSLDPLLEDVRIIYQDDQYRYRAMVYRGGFEHISAYLLLQKYSVNYDGQENPYTLISSVSIDEINNIYNFEMESIKKNEDGFTIILDAVHSYMYEETQITIFISDNLEYEISSGLIKL